MCREQSLQTGHCNCVWHWSIIEWQTSRLTHMDKPASLDPLLPLFSSYHYQARWSRAVPTFVSQTTKSKIATRDLVIRDKTLNSSWCSFSQYNTFDMFTRQTRHRECQPPWSAHYKTQLVACWATPLFIQNFWCRHKFKYVLLMK